MSIQPVSVLCSSMCLYNYMSFLQTANVTWPTSNSHKSLCQKQKYFYRILLYLCRQYYVFGLARPNTRDVAKVLTCGRGWGVMIHFDQLFDSIKFVMEKLIINACEVIFYKVKSLRESKYFFFFTLLSTTS